MQGITTTTILATLSEHDEAGIAAVVVGVVLVALGMVRVAGRAARAMLIPVVGLAVVVVGILFFARVI